jgi:nucleoside-diphosphate kinase
MSATFVMCKPDAVARGLVGEILARFERKGFRLSRLELRHVDRALAECHYAEHAGKPFYESLLAFITRGPVVAMVAELPHEAGDEAWQVARALMGATNPAAAAPGTIRGDLGVDPTENLVHGSDSAASAEREIGLWFGRGGTP